MFIRRLNRKKGTKKPQKRRRKDEGVRHVLLEESSHSSAEDRSDNDSSSLDNENDTTTTLATTTTTNSTKSVRTSAPEIICVHDCPITCVAMASSGGYVWFGDKRGYVNIVDSSCNAPSTRLEPKHKSHVLAMAASDPAVGTPHVVSGSKDGEIFVWNATTRHHVGVLPGKHRQAVYGLTFRVGTNTLFSVSGDRSLMVWSVQDMLQMDTFYGHTASMYAVAAGSKEACFTVGEDREPRLFKIDVAKHNMYGAQQEGIECVTNIRDDLYVVGTVNGTLAVYSTLKSSVQATYPFSHSYGFIGDGTGFEQVVPPKVAEAPTAFNGNAIWAMTKLGGPTLQNHVVVTGSCDGRIRFWKIGPAGNSIHEIASVEVEGIVSGITSSMEGRVVVAAVGREPRRGRWHTWSSATNSLVLCKVEET
eukprot:PhF_6_TR30439/c0_g1_i1/m.44688/K14793/RRP9; ribosomal RNA-processing protein 9